MWNSRNLKNKFEAVLVSSDLAPSHVTTCLLDFLFIPYVISMPPAGGADAHKTELTIAFTMKGKGKKPVILLKIWGIYYAVWLNLEY